MNTKRAPALFVGHGSPTNAIEANSYTKALNQVGSLIEKNTKAVLCISAHWLTAGTWITSSDHPKQIYDFYGFPKTLYEVQYPATGNAAIATEIQEHLKDTVEVKADNSSWGLDHGSWAVLKHIFPKANIPVLQLSIDMSEPPAFHLALGIQLRALRDKGITILGSGNITHNLREVDWAPNPTTKPWAVAFDSWVATQIELKNYHALTNTFLNIEGAKTSVPSLDHYLPLLYVVGASLDNENPQTIFNEMQYGSLSMRSILFFD